jgi:hypothetical protein
VGVIVPAVVEVMAVAVAVGECGGTGVPTSEDHGSQVVGQVHVLDVLTVLGDRRLGRSAASAAAADAYAAAEAYAAAAAAAAVVVEVQIVKHGRAISLAIEECRWLDLVAQACESSS